MNNTDYEKYLCNIVDSLIDEIETLEYDGLTKTQRGMYWALRMLAFRVHSLVKAFKEIGDYERLVEEKHIR